jgi:hypothetical protein
VWNAVQKDEKVAAELGMFRTAVLQRFGDNGMRQMLRAAGQAGVVNTPSVTPMQQKELNQVIALTATLRQGERAAASVAQRQADSERQGQRRGLRM